MREHDRERTIQRLWGLARAADLGPRRSLHEGSHRRTTAFALWRRYRPGRRWLAVHEHGLVYLANNDPPFVVPWGDVVDVRDVARRRPAPAIRHRVTVTTVDGAFTIGPEFRDAEAVGRRLIERLAARTLAEMRATVLSGGVAEHLTWRADRAGLAAAGWAADWDEVVDLRVADGVVRVLLNDDREPTLALGVGSSSTSLAFISLIDQLRRSD